MAESRACTERCRPHGRTSRPPFQNQERWGRDHYDIDEGELLRDNIELQRSAQRKQTDDQEARDAQEIDYANAAAFVGPARNILDQDYARRSMSAQPQQLGAPMAMQGPRQGRLITMITPSVPTQGQIDSDHEIQMIEDLRRHVRDSLIGIPDDLPELKGVHAKLPIAYNGKDDFDILSNWLQGLLQYFKLHRITGVDKDRDQVLVAGTSLAGKAERWFSHEVERPNRITCDWTFKSMIVGIYWAFITTATAQQAMQRYNQVWFSSDEGIMAFYHDLLMWAGRLAQYPDQYSFKRRLFNGMPEEYQHHLALFKGISAEHSSLDAILESA